MSWMWQSFTHALIATSALGAVGVPTAEAALFHSSAASTSISSTPDGTAKGSHHVIDLAGGLVTCGAEMSISGTMNGHTVETLTLEANYGPGGNCTFYGQPTSINMNGCDYRFHSNGGFDIASREGRNCGTEPMTWSVAFPECVIKIGPQTGLTGLGYTGNVGASEITVDINVGGITYTASGAGCLENGTKSNGTYTTGNTWLTGTEDKAGGLMVNLWQESPPPTPAFHSSGSTARISSTPDGTTKGAHHVIDAAGGLLTCGGAQSSLSATTSSGTSEALTIEADYGPESNCTFFGQQTRALMNGCEYIFRANKTLDIASKAGRNCATEPITWFVPNPECHVRIGPQTGLSTVNFTNNGGKTELTLDMSVAGIKYYATGNGCIEVGHNVPTGTYTTGNTWITGTEDKEGGSMVNVWFE